MGVEVSECLTSEELGRWNRASTVEQEGGFVLAEAGRYKYVLNLHPERQWTTHFTKVGGVPESHKDVYDTWLEKAKTDAATAKLIDVIERHPREEFYDTQTDPYELNNLAGRPGQRGRLEKMRARMSERRKQLSDPDE